MLSRGIGSAKQLHLSFLEPRFLLCFPPVITDMGLQINTWLSMMYISSLVALTAYDQLSDLQPIITHRTPYLILWHYLFLVLTKYM